MTSEILLAIAIVAVVLVPTLTRPSLGRAMLSVLFIGGGLFNLLYTLPNAPRALLDLVALAPIPPYREVIIYIVGWNAAQAFVLLLAAFEIVTGSLILRRGTPPRVGLLAAGAWCLGMLPVVPPDGVLVGVALTGTPGVAALLLARGACSDSIPSIARRHLHGNSVRRPLRIAVHPISAVLIFAGLCALFATVLHPWFMNWGATAEERATALPGDTAPPEAYFTRAISIDAPPSAVWPWLLAIGQDRAGFLSNDYLENLAGSDIHNADTLRPEWQQRGIGDRVPMAGEAERSVAGDYTLLTVRIIETERVIGDIPGRFVLQPVGESGTRLLLREPLAIPERAGYAWVVWDPMHFMMEQRMLRGIKERAENRPLVPPVVAATAQAGWVLASLGLFGLFLGQRRWRAWLLLPLAVVAPSLSLTGDLSSGMAGFLAVGITVAGFLARGWQWCAPYLLVASAVALVLLLAADSYAAFGLIFLALLGATFVQAKVNRAPTIAAAYAHG